MKNMTLAFVILASLMVSSLSIASIKTNYGGLDNGFFWIYEPEHPRYEISPIVFFLPGFVAPNPINYGMWFDHLTQEGFVVVYLSIMNADGVTKLKSINDRAFDAYQKAWSVIRSRKRSDGSVMTPMDFSKIAFIGHSAGGDISGDLAARAKINGLPYPGLLFSVDPAKTSFYKNTVGQGPLVQLGDIAHVDDKTMLFAVYGDMDRFFGMRGCEAYVWLDMATNVPDTQKYIVKFESDLKSGEKATHFFASAPDPFYDNGIDDQKDTNGFLKQMRIEKRHVRLGQLVFNDLDVMLWEAFDQAFAFTFNQVSMNFPFQTFTGLPNFCLSR